MRPPSTSVVFDFLKLAYGWAPLSMRFTPGKNGTVVLLREYHVLPLAGRFFITSTHGKPREDRVMGLTIRRTPQCSFHVALSLYVFHLSILISLLLAIDGIKQLK